MKKLNYTIEQVELLGHVEQKIRKLFLENPVPAHGIEHISRVVEWARKIAPKEKAKSIFLCELAAWLHDIGRLREDNPGEDSRKHHELSYIMLQEWFREDKAFDILSKKEKLELLYAVRYHWNNMADKYDTAWILRDADKLDAFGKVGIERVKELFPKDEEWNLYLRHIYEIFIHVRTKTAKKIIKDKKLMDAVEKEYKSYLKSKIEPVEL